MADVDTKTNPAAVRVTTPVQVPAETGTNPLPDGDTNTNTAITPAPAPASLPPQYTDGVEKSNAGAVMDEKAQPEGVRGEVNGEVKGQADPRLVPIESAHLDPVFVKCAFCGWEGDTRVELENGSRSFAFAAIGCFLIGIFGLIPLCVPTCKDRKHLCARCGGLLKHWEYRSRS